MTAGAIRVHRNTILAIDKMMGCNGALMEVIQERGLVRNIENEPDYVELAEEVLKNGNR